jgi:spermidine synthase
MSARFEELDHQPTPMGDISLRRRRDPALGVDVYEVKLGDEFLMSSLFVVAEIALADLGLAQASGDQLDVVVGGLGLGCTARAALADPRVRSLAVVEALDEVIGWHRRELLPYAGELVSDPSCRLVSGDFFARVASGNGFGDGVPEQVDAVLLDVDHSPTNVLHPSHAGFYTAAGLRRLADRLRPAGVFALWSDDPPDQAFSALLDDVFGAATATVVPFANPITGGESANTVYVAVRD